MGASLRCATPGARPDWLPSYYHRADKQGIGLTAVAKRKQCCVAQYPENLALQYDNISTCPEEYLLWFHHVPWNYRMKSGRTAPMGRVLLSLRQWSPTSQRLSEDMGCRRKNTLTQNVSMRSTVRFEDTGPRCCLVERRLPSFYFPKFSSMPIPLRDRTPYTRIERLAEDISPISNYECPTKELLNKKQIKKKASTSVWQKGAKDITLHSLCHTCLYSLKAHHLFNRNKLIIQSQ